MLISFDLDGVAISSGSACSSGKVARSHVLEAMGAVPELAKAALRVSFGWNSTGEDIERFMGAWRRIVERSSPRRALTGLKPGVSGGAIEITMPAAGITS
jgi:cysteine desulfurase